MRAVDPAIKIVAGVLAMVDVPQPRPARSTAARAAGAFGVRPQLNHASGISIADAIEYAQPFLSEPGTAEAVDILTYHPYNPAPEATVDDIAAPCETIRAIKPGLPVWQGECGCPSSGDTIHFRGDAPWGYNVQCKWLLRRLLTDYLAGAEVSVYFLNVEFHGTMAPGMVNLPTGYNTKGLIQHTTWQTKPAFYALQNLIATIDGTCTPVDEKASMQVVDPGTFYGIGPHESRFPCVPWQLALRKAGRHGMPDLPMLAYWLPWRPQEIVRAATVHVDWALAAWNEPVVVDLLTGEVSEAKAAGGSLEVPLADYPFVLTERKALELADTPQQPGHEETVAKLRWTY